MGGCDCTCVALFFFFSFPCIVVVDFFKTKIKLLCPVFYKMKI